MEEIYIYVCTQDRFRHLIDHHFVLFCFVFICMCSLFSRTVGTTFFFFVYIIFRHGVSIHTDQYIYMKEYIHVYIYTEDTMRCMATQFVPPCCIYTSIPAVLEEGYNLYIILTTTHI